MTRLTEANKKNLKFSTIWLGIPSFFRSKDSIVLTLSLTLLLVGASFLFETSNERVYWLYDDTEHLSIAYNLFHDKGLSRDFIDMGASTTGSNIPHLMGYDQISNFLRSKPPLHLVLLGGWLFIVGATYTNWFFWGSMFNFILAAVSVFLFYLFAKRYFGFEIAAYTTPVLAIMPPLVWYSVRIRPDLLAFIFMILAFYYAAKKITYQNIIVVGVLSAMAHLSHPIGLMAVSTFAIYFLLLRRSFKATTILLATWLLVIFPWMVRNYILFGDATQGLGLPIPYSVSTTLGLVTPGASGLNSADVGTITGIPLSQTLIGMLDEFTDLYGMQFFMILIACSVIAYLSFPALRRAISSLYAKTLLILGVIMYIQGIIFAASLNDLTFQLIVFFFVPLSICLGIRFFSRHRDIFTTEAKDIYKLLAILAVVSFVPYLMYAQTTGRIVPEVRIVIFSLFMLVPLAVIGIRKLLKAILGLFIHSLSLRRKTVILSMCSILFLFSLTQISVAIPTLIRFQDSFAETEPMKEIHMWIIEHIPPDSKIASNLPHAILLRTGHEAVNFATAYLDNSQYERWVVKKFDIDYLVFYGSANTAVLDNTKDLGNIEFRMVYRSEGGEIYKVVEK